MAIARCLKKKLFILLIFNLLIVFTYGIKIILSCNDYFIIYNSCSDFHNQEFFIIFVIVSSFFAGQFISLTNKSFKINLAPNIIYFNNYRYVITYLIILTFLTWSQSGSFQEYDSNRVSQAASNGLINLVAGSITMLVLISVRYQSIFYTAIIAALTFTATGTKQMLFLPVILYLFNSFKTSNRELPIIKLGIFFIASIILAQILRSSSESEINIDYILLNLAIPFDALDNGVEVLGQIYKDNLLRLIYPYDLYYLFESLLNFVPRSIWLDKPEVMGFWRIQRDYLPELYTSTSGMSVSTSLPVDIVLSFGILLGSIVIFLFANFIKEVDSGNINIGFAYPLLLISSVDFSRGGFRNFGMTILQFFTILFFIYLIKVVTAKKNIFYCR